MLWQSIDNSIYWTSVTTLILNECHYYTMVNDSILSSERSSRLYRLSFRYWILRDESSNCYEQSRNCHDILLATYCRTVYYIYHWWLPLCVTPRGTIPQPSMCTWRRSLQRPGRPTRAPWRTAAPWGFRCKPWSVRTRTQIRQATMCSQRIPTRVEVKPSSTFVWKGYEKGYRWWARDETVCN